MSIDESLSVFADLVVSFASRYQEVSSGATSPPHSSVPMRAGLNRLRLSTSLNDSLGWGRTRSAWGTRSASPPPRDPALAAAIEGPVESPRLAWHFHDTRGTAVANVFAALELGYRVFDSSAGGLGGCPYAPGAGGNLATDDLVYALEREGITMGWTRSSSRRLALPVLQILGRAPSSRAQQAVLSAACS